MNDDIVIIIGKLVGLLESLTEEKGVPKGDDVDKNIVKSPNSPFDNNKTKANLSSKEKKRLTETFNLFNSLFFDAQKKNKADVKESTLVSKIQKQQTKAKENIPTDKEKKGGGMLGMVLAGLSLLAASVGGVVAALTGFFGNYSGVVKAIGKLGMMGALKILSKTILKKLSLKILKRLPVIGGIIGLAYAVKAFKNGDIFLGIAELISGVLNFIPGVGPFLSLGADILIAWAQAKGVFDEGGILSPENGWNTIKGWAKGIGKTIMDNALYLPVIGTIKRLGMAWDAIKSGDYVEGIKQIGLGILTVTPAGGLLIKGFEVLSGWLSSEDKNTGDFNEDKSWLDKLKGWIKSKLEKLPWPIRKALSWFGILKDDVKDVTGSIEDKSKKASGKVMDFVGGVWDKVKGPMQDTVESLGSMSSSVWDKTKNLSQAVWDKVSEEAPKVWNSVKDLTDKAWDKAKDAGSWFMNSIKSISEKSKEVLNKWIPDVMFAMNAVKGVSEKAIKALKGIANKIGDWISNLFSSDDKKKPNINASSNSPSKSTNETVEVLVKNSETQRVQAETAFKYEKIKVDLLHELVSVAKDTNKNIKNINSSGGKAPSISSSVISTPSKNYKQYSNNRSEFASSAYSVG